jgi:hypothetical protein
MKLISKDAYCKIPFGFSLKEYFEYIEQKRKLDLAELNKKYKIIGPLVTKVEGIVFNTNSACSPKMTRYYQYWEKEIFNSLTKVYF